MRELIVHAMQQAGVTDPTQFPAPDRGSSPWPDSRLRDGPRDELQAKFDAIPHRRFFSSHIPLDGLQIYAQVKYLIIARDPRDVFMSFWNHYAGYTDSTYGGLNDTPGRQGDPLPRCPSDIHELWAMWISRGWFAWEQEGYPFWGNMHHTQTWWDYRHLANIQFFHYADMLADPKEEIKRIADFLDIAVSDEVLSFIVQQTSLSAMRQRNLDDPILQSVWKEGANTFYFKGTNGRWRNVLSEDELAMYEATKSKVLTPECARWLEQGWVALS